MKKVKPNPKVYLEIACVPENTSGRPSLGVASEKVCSQGWRKICDGLHAATHETIF